MGTLRKFLLPLLGKTGTQASRNSGCNTLWISGLEEERQAWPGLDTKEENGGVGRGRGTHHGEPAILSLLFPLLLQPLLVEDQEDKGTSFSCPHPGCPSPHTCMGHKGPPNTHVFKYVDPEAGA